MKCLTCNGKGKDEIQAMLRWHFNKKKDDTCDICEGTGRISFKLWIMCVLSFLVDF